MYMEEIHVYRSILIQQSIYLKSLAPKIGKLSVIHWATLVVIKELNSYSV